MLSYNFLFIFLLSSNIINRCRRDVLNEKHIFYNRFLSFLISFKQYYFKSTLEIIKRILYEASYFFFTFRLLF